MHEGVQQGFIIANGFLIEISFFASYQNAKAYTCRWHISLIQTEVQATDASGTEGKGDLYISPTATTPMTNFSH
jgi:hypothetical protein